jgi:hypothetical protein
MSPSKSSKRELSPEHKAALAVGRTEGRAVRKYLEALEAHKPKRGRKRTPESISSRLEKIDALLETADPVKRVDLIQERLDLIDELARLETNVDLSGLESDFVAAVKGYSERKGISYAAWREAGVSASVLKNAGISRAGS